MQKHFFQKVFIGVNAADHNANGIVAVAAHGETFHDFGAFARGLFPVVPGTPEARVDIVPVDTVADALLTLATAPAPAATGTFHVVAGDDAPTARRLTELAASAFDAPLPDFVAPGSAPEVEQRAGAFLPYFRVPGVFRTDASSRLGFIAPPLETYFTTLLRYADEARWGRNNRARWTTAPVA